jgi:flagellar biosynthesis protein FlhA
LGEDGLLHTLSLESSLERQISEGIRKTANELTLVLEPGIAIQLIEAFSLGIQQMTASGLHPVLVCSPQIRLPLYRFLQPTFPNLVVISIMELPRELSLKNFQSIELTRQNKPNPIMEDNPELQPA